MPISPLPIAPLPISPVPIPPAAIPIAPLPSDVAARVPLPPPPARALPQPVLPAAPPELLVPLIDNPDAPATPPLQWLPLPDLWQPVTPARPPQVTGDDTIGRDPAFGAATRTSAGRRRGPRRWAVLLPVIALIGGAAIGLATRGLRGAPPPDAAPDPVGAVTLAPPVVTGIVDGGDAVRLTWTDPTDGQAIFVISEITSDDPRPLRQVPPGTTETIITGLDPYAAQYCFRVLAVQGTASAASATICTPVRSLDA
jgi:hypothetical protein